jgi:hypothetical protein
MTQAFHEIVNYEVSYFQVPKSEMQLVVVPSECKTALKGRLQDEDTTQELI